MKKIKNNNKGFTLIELLAVIVILAILVMVAIPAVTKYLETARKGTYADAAQSAISAVRMDYTSKGRVGAQTYVKKDINNLLEKKLISSPFGKNYTENIYITVTPDTNNSEKLTYHICLDDEAGYVLNKDESDATSDNVTKATDQTKCIKQTSTIS